MDDMMASTIVLSCGGRMLDMHSTTLHTTTRKARSVKGQYTRRETVFSILYSRTRLGEVTGKVTKLASCSLLCRGATKWGMEECNVLEETYSTGGVLHGQRD
jgi:hypothetical protein